MNPRRHALARIAAAALAAACVSSQAAGIGEQLGALFSAPKGRLSVVLVDTTGSISPQDWQLYERAMHALLDSAKPGDRIVLAAVHDRPGSRFLVHADHSFKVSGNSMHDKVWAQRTAQAVQADFATLREANAQPARATLLIDAVGATAELFAQGRSRAQALQMLVLSDMVEESTSANFARKPVTPKLAEQVIEAQRRRSLLPDLTGVNVYVIGASGRDAAHMASIRTFWQSYFAATGASLITYGRNPGALET